MEVSAAASAIKRWRRSTGATAPARSPSASSSLLLPPIANAKVASSTTASPPTSTTDLKHSAPQLLQIYFDRWQIEVNHRDEKDTLGVGQAQLWNVDAVPKQPALVVAAYSALLLASLQAFGTERSQVYAALPRWRRHAHRPSCLDLVTLLREEMVDHPEYPQSLGFQLTDRALTHAADA